MTRRSQWLLESICLQAALERSGCLEASLCRVHFMLAAACLLPVPCGAKVVNHPLHGHARAVLRLDSHPARFTVQALEP